MNKTPIALFLFSTAITLSASFVSATDMTYSEYANVTVSNSRETRINFNMPNIPFRQVNEEGMDFIQFEEDEFPLTVEFGKPELPFITTFVAIPARAGVEVSVNVNYAETMKNVVVYPSQNEEVNEREGGLLSPGFEFDQEFYNNGSTFPEKESYLSSPSVLRDFRIVNLRVYPYTYDPQSKELTIAKDLEIVLDYSSTDLTNALDKEPTTVSKAFDPLYKTTIINYETLGTQTATVSYYVIYAPLASNPSLTAVLQPFVDWKNQKGVLTTIVDSSPFQNVGSPVSYPQSITQTPSPKGGLREDLEARFNSSTPPDFAMIIGDENVTNTHFLDYTNDPPPYPGAASLSGNFSNESYWYNVAGNDYFPDIFHSRIPTSVTGSSNLQKVQRALNKLIQYEKNPYINPNVDWYRRGIVAANDAYVSQKDTKRKIRDEMYEFGDYVNVDTFFVDGGAQQNEFVQAFENGAAFVNYRGEGWVTGWSAMSFGTSSASGLANTNMTPIATSIGCGVTQYKSSSECLGQALIFNGGTSSYGGTVAFVGPTWNTHTGLNNKNDLGLYDAIFQLEHEHLATAFLHGQMYMYGIYGGPVGSNADETMKTAFDQYVIFGDAEINMRTTTPKTVNVLASSAVVPNSTLNVVVTDVNTGSPLGGITVCAYTDDQSVFFVGETDVVGQIPVQIGAGTVGTTLHLTVAGRNIIPVQQNYTISNPNQFVTFENILIDDSVNGNGNGKVNPGETVDVGLVLHNFGTQSASNVTATISTSDTLVTIVQNSISYGNIASGATAQPPTSFQLQLDSEFVEFHAITMLLTISDGIGNNWTEPLNMPLGTPSLVYQEVLIEDNSNFHPNSLDPGETGEMRITLQNKGWGVAENFNGILTTGNPNITITDFNATYDITLEPDSTGGALISDAFEVSVPANFPVETPVEFILYITSGASSSYPYSFAIPFTMTVGKLFPEDPSMSDTYGYYAIENGDQVLEAPTYNWIELAQGVGTQMNFPVTISDYTLIVPLPFNFTFYGNSFTHISISSDGFAMMGSNNATQWKNENLPFQDNLSNMICPFWTDLRKNGGDSGRIYNFYDTVNNLYIIQWNALQHYSGDPNPSETFQMILKDPAFHSTPTGDGEIIFQYKDIDPTRQEYVTVGIENGSQTDALMYKGKNVIANSSEGLLNNKAILFTTKTPTLTTSLEENSNPQVAKDYDLKQNFPNPFNPSTNIEFTVPEQGQVELQIFNVLGQKVRTLVSEKLQAGNFTATWNGTDESGKLVSSGVYFYKLTAGEFSQTRKMVFLK